MKKTYVSALASLTLCSFINADCLQVKADDATLQEQISALNAKIDELAAQQLESEKAQKVLKDDQKFQAGMISKVNAQSANDNIKWDLDFRSAYHNLNRITSYNVCYTKLLRPPRPASAATQRHRHRDRR